MLPIKYSDLRQLQFTNSILALFALVAFFHFSTSIPIWLFAFWCFFYNAPLALNTSTQPAAANTLAALSQSPANNFNLLRLLAAWSVLFFHGYVLTGTAPTSWFDTHIGRYMGFYAVNTFFFISGFLVTQSIERSSVSRRYLTLRFVRLVPPLCVVMLASILLAGPLMTTLPIHDYFTSMSEWLYLAASTSMKNMHFTLPGVFANNHYPDIVNGSLWTLSHEMRLYLLLFLLAQLGVIHNRQLLYLTTVGIFAFYFMHAFQIEAISGLTEAEREKDHNIILVHLYFFLGFLAAKLALHLPVRWRHIALLAVTATCFQHTTLHDLSIAVLVGYLVLLLAYRSGSYFHAYNKLSDYSYGTYLYAFPIQQMLMEQFPTLDFTELVLYATPATLCCAIGSWHLLEKPLMIYFKKLYPSKNPVENDTPDFYSQVKA